MTPTSSTSITSQPEPTVSGSGLRVAGIVTASVGVAAVVTGILLNVKVNGMVDSMDTTIGNYEAKNSDRKTYETIAWIGYGAGAACLVTGAILYRFGLSRARAATSLALLPAVGPDRAGALLSGEF